ncbi:uncharacterized protein LOC144436550 [Glandiceps talaboti]
MASVSETRKSGENSEECDDKGDEPDGRTAVSFRTELRKIIEELNREPDSCKLLDDVKFLVTANIIEDGVKSQITNFYDLFTELERRGVISIDNTEYLVDVLHAIHRDPLANRLAKRPWRRLKRGNSITDYLKRKQENLSEIIVGFITILIVINMIMTVAEIFILQKYTQNYKAIMFFNVPPKHRYYYGQDVHLEKLEKCLEKHHLCLLKGIQGNGKKCLLKTYTHDTIEKYSDGVFWLTSRADIITMAGYIATVKDEVLVMQSEQNYAFFENAVRYIRQYLSNHNKWLVVYVDVDLLSDIDLQEMQRIVHDLTPSADGKRRHVLYSAQVRPAKLLNYVQAYELNWALTSENAHQFLRDGIEFSSCITETEKRDLQQVWKAAGCHPYSVSKTIQFIKDWNFTLEAFLDHWQHATKEEWLEIFGYEPEKEIMQKQLDLLRELEVKQPETVNMLLEYIKSGNERHEIPGCDLHAKYKGVSLKTILKDLKNISFVDVKIDTTSKDCSFAIPAILRLVLEVSLIQRGKLENWHVQTEE